MHAPLSSDITIPYKPKQCTFLQTEVAFARNHRGHTNNYAEMSSAPAQCFFIFFVLVFSSVVRVGKCAPPTCYSRAVQLSKEIMDVLEKTHRSPRTKECAEIFPKMFLDVHNSCVTAKLRDFLYVLENLPEIHCRTRPRIVFLKRKILTLYEIISRACYRDLVYLTNDCEALDTGISYPRYAEDTLQLLEETS
ncbi:hypothetical protein AMELA_G00019920 [Ameiurus melas]|uniref:Cytokine-like protein 1 n=1 Tax=Ameiurus melas TaxID=219545 RepID=A0A7J6BBD4_AMEME|nr:hypothetical protein AMELA_G00019920 [Ameiurus melas]